MRDSCSDGTSITRHYGDLDTCATRVAQGCTAALAAPGTGATVATVAACTTALATVSCSDFFDGVLPADCTPAGSRPDGAPCAIDGQCASVHCGGSLHASCGTCAPAPAPTDSCADSTCGPDMVCVDATMLCAVYAALGTYCDPDEPCVSGLACVGAAYLEICQPPVTQAGLPCDTRMHGCDGSLGLFCSGDPGAQTCAAIVYVGDGLSCGHLSSTSSVLCNAGTCYTAGGVAAGGETGVCRRDALEGAACDVSVGPSCLPPGRCVVPAGETAGTCTLPSGDACG